MLYFAYGSNLDCIQMRQRCPTTRFVCRAVLKDHRVAITRQRKDGTGTADVVKDPGHDVWGVVYEINGCDIGNLDASEGYQVGRALNSYIRHDAQKVWADGDVGKPLTVSIYIAVQQPNPPAPAAAYKSRIVNGSRFWNLPANYTNELEATI